MFSAVLPRLAGPQFAFGNRSAVRFASSAPKHQQAAGAQLSQDDLDKLALLAQMRLLPFRNQFQKVIDDAKAHLQVWLANHQAAQSAVVLDLDETLLDNSGIYLRNIAQPVPVPKPLPYPGWKDYHQGMMQAQSPAIPETMALVRWMLAQGFRLFFVSARREPMRAATALNLERIGLPAGSYEGLVLRPMNDRQRSPATFKLNAQKDIAAQGYQIAMVMGDQSSDLQGALGQPFKLPNPLYNVP